MAPIICSSSGNVRGTGILGFESLDRHADLAGVAVGHAGWVELDDEGVPKNVALDLLFRTWLFRRW
jgi:hypothetical protein